MSTIATSPQRIHVNARISMNKYRYNDEVDPDTGKQKHLHQVFKDEKWSNLTGTSTVVSKTIPKPLTWWASGLAVGKLGWVKAKDWKTLKTKEDKDTDLKRRLEAVSEPFETIKSMDVVSYLKLLDSAYRAHDESLDKSAQKGTDLHAELERYVKDVMNDNDGQTYDDKILPFIEWSKKNVKKFWASEGHCYSEVLWVGGKFDVIAELNDGEFAIIDFKSSKEAYKSQFIQIGGYAIEVEENGVLTKNGELLFKLDKPITQFIVIPFGSPRPAPTIMRGVETFKKGFKDAVSLYHLLENYEE